MKFIDFDDIATDSLAASIARVDKVSVSDSPKSGKLIARWEVMEGKLICKWLIE